MVKKVDGRDPRDRTDPAAEAGTVSGGRRKFLKTAAVTAGAAASTGLIDGFPLVWSQNMKDVKLVQVGGSYSAIKEIADQATKDLGFKVEMQTAPHDALLNRLADPAAVHRHRRHRVLLPAATCCRAGTLHPIDLKKIKLWDKVVPIFTKGEYPDGRKVSTQGVLPFEVQYIEKAGDKKFATKPTEPGHRHPDRLQRRHAGHPPRPGQAQDRQLGRAAQSRVEGQDRRSCRCPASASWTPPWRSRRAATSSTTTRAT